MYVDHHLLLWVQPLSSVEVVEFLHFIFWDLSRGAQGLGLGFVISNMPAALGWGVGREGCIGWASGLGRCRWSHTMAI